MHDPQKVEITFPLSEEFFAFHRMTNGYMRRFAAALMQKRCSSLREDEVWDVWERDCNTPLMRVLPRCGEDLLRGPLSLPQIKPAKMGNLRKKKEGLSDRAIYQAAELLHQLVLWQLLSNQLNVVIQSLSENEERDSLRSTMMGLFVALVDCCHQGMKSTIHELLNGSYYELWAKRHHRVFTFDGTMRRKANDVTLLTSDQDDEALSVSIHDSDLLVLLGQFNQLPVSCAQHHLRALIASLQYQQDLLAGLKQLRRQHLKSLTARDVDPVYFDHLSHSRQQVFEFCAYLWGAEPIHPFLVSFQKHWQQYQERPDMVIEEGPYGASQIQLLTASVVYRDRAMSELSEIIKKAQEIVCVRGLSQAALQKIIKAAKEKRLRFIVLTLEKSTFFHLQLRLQHDLLRGRSSYESMKKELLDLLSWLAYLNIRRESPFSKLLDVVYAYRFFVIESPMYDLVKRHATQCRKKMVTKVHSSRLQAWLDDDSGDEFPSQPPIPAAAAAVADQDALPDSGHTESGDDADASQEEEAPLAATPELRASVESPEQPTPPTPHEPPPALDTQLPIVGSQRAYWWSLGWFGVGKRSKRDDVCYALYQVRAMVQRLRENAAATLADGTRVSDRLTTVLLETLDRAGSHRVARRETPAESHTMHVARSGRHFVKRLLRRENRYYLEVLLMAAEKLNQEIDTQHDGLSASSCVALRAFRDDRDFSSQLSQLRSDFSSRDNARTLRERINTASRALFTFRVLHHLSRRIKQGGQEYTVESARDVGQRFFAAHRAHRSVLLRSDEADALSAAGRAAARGEVVTDLAV